MDLKKLSWFFEDQVRAAHSEFLARIPANGGSFLDALGDSLPRRLFEQTHRMLVAQYKLIEGTVSFDDFCTSLRQPEIRTYLHHRYPVLREWMTRACRSWLEQSCSLTERFLADSSRLQSEIFHDSSPLDVTHVELGLGDLHRGGRSVALLRLRDGRKLLYKPRSLAIDTHFQALVQWLGDKCNMDFRTPEHLDRGDYGWVQFIEQKECDNSGQVDRFYHRLGGLLGVLYAIEGTDFHYENIIAAGEHPVLIDLESLFQPPVPAMAGEANGAMGASVLKVGILPNRTAGASGLPETGGISNAEGQPGLNRLHLMRGEDGEPSLVRGRAGLLPARNVPTLQGSRVQMDASHVQQLQRGFEEVYRTILANRSELESLLDQFSGDQTRVLFRHTATYSHLRDEARHPSSMTSFEAVAERFELLRLVVPDYAIAERFVQFEIEDLARGDIPLFTTRVASRHLWYSDDACIENFFDESGRDAAAKKLELLSEQDLGRQLWIISNSFGLREGRRGLLPSRDTPVQLPSASEPGDRLIAAASSIADELSARIHVDGDCASWLVHTPTSLDNRQFDLAPASYDLYCG
ncbi:MAG: type 2 lantipeptide synthetase LanM, partial [Lysobacter sp.]|nr:type 2 lantipeptide synthetase LanM [Lysobacter sp.]